MDFDNCLRLHLIPSFTSSRRMLAALTSFVKRCCGGSAYAATEEDSPPPNGESDRPFVSAHWLWQNRTSVKIVDGRHLQSNNLTAAGAYAQGHIPGAIFFDIARFTYPYNDYIPSHTYLTPRG